MTIRRYSVTVTNNSNTRGMISGLGRKLYEGIADAIVEGDRSTTHELVEELCERVGADRVARALTIGGLIGSRVHRAAKPLTRSEDAGERAKGQEILSRLIHIDCCIPLSVVNERQRPRVGVMSF